MTNAIILPPTKPISRLIRNLNIKVSDTIVISVNLQQPNQEFSIFIRNPNMKASDILVISATMLLPTKEALNDTSNLSM